MKLLLLKTLLQRRARDEGFTLPMVIALGLVMLLLGAVSITIANEENITAITQNSRSDALAIAEIGVARYRELLDRNRILTLYDERLPTTAESLAGVTDTQTKLWTRTDVCSSDLASFRRTTTATPIPPKTIIDSQDRDNDGDTTEEIGKYSLVSYDFIYDNPSAPDIDRNGDFDLTNDTTYSNARGILKVKGTAPDGSEAQIEAEIPVRINLEDMNTIAPALWIGDSSVSADDLSPLTIGNGNVVIKDQASADGCNGFSALASTTPRRPVISDSRDLPPISQILTDIADAKSKWSITSGSINNISATEPATVTETKTVTVAGVTTTTAYKKVLFGSTTDKVYKPLEPGPPQVASSKDCPNIKVCRYYYDSNPAVTSVLTYTDTDLLTDGIARTTLLLNRPLTIEATNTVVTGQNVKIGSTSPVANDSNSFEIYVNGNHDITINVASGRTVTINGFIHAPDSTLKINGAGNVTINGSVWVNDFINSSTGMVNISPDTITRIPTANDLSTSGKGYRFYSTTNSRTPRPITGSPTNWKTEEVN